jgi:hypothetical protein
MQLRATALLVFILFGCVLRSYSQDSSAYAKLYSLPDKVFNRISEKSKNLEQKLARQTQRYVARLARHESKMRNKLRKKDPAAAKAIFGDVGARYKTLQQDVDNSSTAYNSHLDSLQIALRFLQQQQQQLSGTLTDPKYTAALNNFTLLQNKLDQTEKVKSFLKERQQYLKTQLQRFGLAKEFRKYQQKVYYYREQVDEYKRMLDDPSNLEARLLQLANKVPAFHDFFSKYSLLATMFPQQPNDPGAPLAQLAGLQTRASIQQMIEERFGAGTSITTVMRQNMHDAHSQLDQLKDRVSKLGQNGGDLDMPGFKPNSQKVKSIWTRIELGANMQSTKANGYFPVTSDIAFTAGYKLNDRSIAGIGVSYKLGWGQNIRNISLSHEGVGLRSFVDLKLKGSFYAAGGLEYNYQKPFSSMRQLYGLNNWQQSGLIGVSKIVSVQNRFFKKTKLQLLWDFLSYQQVPRAQPLKFRVGYSF